jgi:colanic acid/amylovoran biosynthesis glycosyltransferase
MKIGIVLSNSPSYSETFFSSKIRGLQENGMEVRLYCQSKTNNFTLCPVILSSKISRNPLIQLWYFIREFTLLLPHLPAVIRYVKLERKERSGLLQILKKIYLNAHLLKSKLEWLHFGFATMALGSETVAKAIGAKMAVSIRGFDIAVYPIKNAGCYNTLWKYLDKIHTISNDLLVLAENHGLPETVPVVKITPAIDVNLFQYISQNVGTPDTIVFMTTGRLHWKKGFVRTIKALAILKEQGLNFRYKIIGEGAEYERIAFAAYQLDLKDDVQFLGKLPHEEVKKELESATIYLQYSIQEGFCNAVLEAQAMGKLCIVSNAEGLPENVLDGITGWVAPKYNPQVLSETIQKVLALNPEQKKLIAETAQMRVKEEFNIEKQQREFVEFYRF